MNIVSLIGRLSRDVEFTKGKDDDISVAKFVVAVDNLGKDAGASFIQCVMFGKRAEAFAKFFHKGSIVGVSGRIVQRTYEKKDGTKANIVEVVCDNFDFCESKKPLEENNMNEKPKELDEDEDILPF